MRKNQKYRHTLYGQRSRYGFFTLSPFEPPSVPLEAEYQVRFVQKIPPHFELPAIVKTWRKRVPYMRSPVARFHFDCYPLLGTCDKFGHKIVNDSVKL